jgi:hypothetical protein
VAQVEARGVWDAEVVGSSPITPTGATSGSSLVGKASAFQAEDREFESRLPLLPLLMALLPSNHHAWWLRRRRVLPCPHCVLRHTERNVLPLLSPTGALALWRLSDGMALHSLRPLVGQTAPSVLQRYLALAGEDIERAH